MYIEPNGRVWLISFCPLDNSYNNTFYFNNEIDKFTHFTTKYITTPYTKMSYQRYARNVLTVKYDTPIVFTANYMVFENSVFNKKKFYAFVNKVEYINNNTVRVYYEIDIIQTYGGYLEYLPCFIEREHTATDAIGDNLVPESFNIQDYTNYNEKVFVGTELSLVIQWGGTDIPDSIASKVSQIFGDSPPIIKEKVACGSYTDASSLIYPINNNTIDNINELIGSINILTFGELINIFMIPTEFANSYLEQKNNVYNSGLISSYIYRPTNIDGYPPRNNKLFTSPFLVASISNGMDQSVELAFERSTTDNLITFNAICPLNSGGRILAYPLNYNGEHYAYDMGVNSAPLPNATFVGDKFSNWFANNSLSLISCAISGGMVTPSIETTPITRSYAKTNESSVVPYNAGEASRNERNEVVGYNTDISVDNCLNSIVNIAAHAQGGSFGKNGVTTTIFGGNHLITIKCKSIKDYVAKTIDDFFTKYGYAVKEIKIPNRNARESFTYVKTIGCSIRPIFDGDGGCPADTLRKICDIHDKGITYWNPEKVVGDYSQSNRPISEV